jgi:hypothetical protein
MLPPLPGDRIVGVDPNAASKSTSSTALDWLNTKTADLLDRPALVLKDAEHDIARAPPRDDSEPARRAGAARQDGVGRQGNIINVKTSPPPDFFGLEFDGGGKTTAA